jgi:sterol 3beta-glucosyltransferase
VTLAYTNADGEDYDAQAESLDLTPVKIPLPGDPPAAAALSDLVGSSNPLRQYVLLVERFFEPAVDAMFEASMQLCREHDVVIGHSMVHTLVAAAELQRTPRGVLAFCPMAVDSDCIPPTGVPNLGRWGNKLMWAVANRLMLTRCFPTLNPWRAAHGLAPVKSLRREVYISKYLTLVAASRSLCPPLPDYGDHVQPCGFLAVPNEETWQMPDDLRAFLDNGEPPVFLTFGSFCAHDPEATLRLLLRAAELSGRRAIIQGEWDAAADPHDDENIYRIGRAPHSRIFPHTALVVHHGGAGTTHSAIAAGKPSIVVAHAFDQAYWGSRLKAAGVGGKLLRRRKLTAEELARQIKKMLGAPDHARRAEALGKAVAAENAHESAVSMVETRFSTR